MLLGLDHAIVAVRDLSAGMARLEGALGVTVTRGGEHPGRGTHNVIVRFGVQYLELISVRNPTEASTDPRGRVVLEATRAGDGLLGFAIGSDNIEADMAEASGRNVRLAGPITGGRNRPDGSVMTWRQAYLEDDPYGRVLPFLIQHDTPIEERRSWTPPEGHGLRVTGVPLVSVAVGNLESSTEAYRRLLGEPPEVVEEVPALPARRTRFVLGNSRVELLQPAATSGGLADFVATQGDGLFMITLSVPNLEEAVAFLRGRGTAVANPTPRRRAPLLDPSQTLGARFQLVEGR